MTETPLTELRELWQSQRTQAFQLSPEEIHARIERFERRSRRAALDSVLAFGSITLVCIGFVVLFHNPLLQIGSVLTIAAFGFLAWEMRSGHLRERDASRRVAETGTVDSVAFHRGQLQRQRDRHEGARFWRRWLGVLPGPLMFFAGFAQARPDLIAIISVQEITFLIAVVSAIPLNRRVVRQCEDRLRILDRLRD